MWVRLTEAFRVQSFRALQNPSVERAFVEQKFFTTHTQHTHTHTDPLLMAA